MDPRGQDPSATRSLRPQATSARGEAAYFLVVQGASSSIFPLPSDGTVLIGRSQEADLALQDDSCSRRHARVVISQGEIRVNDLDSHNGTAVNGERIRAARVLTSGDVVAIGAASLVLHRSTQPQRARLVPTPLFLERLAAEIERALAYGRDLSVALISLQGDEELAQVARATEPGDLPRILDATLRPLDVATMGDDGALTVLMPEMSGDPAQEMTRTLVSALVATSPVARAGLASCPADGCDVEALIGAARSAAAVANAGTLRVAQPTQAEVAVGERRIIVADAAMIRLFELIRRLARSDLPVLVSGETGAGKENAAFAVHAWSSRSEKPFVSLNCAAIQETLVESELFGYEKGAFSGAAAAKEGLLESADGGTIFLDEVGELSAATQAKLLRALEARKFTRVGGLKEREVDIRIVAATNRDLAAEVKEGRFRQDLFFRLAAATVVLPPLRDRPRELAILARRFLDSACERGERDPMRISAATMRHLSRHDWPGNVRELKNLMEFCAATILEDAIEPWHLPDTVTGAEEGSAGEEESGGASPSAGSFRPVADELKDLERRRMVEALEASGGVKKHAAQLIGMPLRTFVFKCRQYDLT